jgi:hypothetical protein
MALITVERARRAFAPRAWTDADNSELAQAGGTAVLGLSKRPRAKPSGATYCPVELSRHH